MARARRSQKMTMCTTNLLALVTLLTDADKIFQNDLQRRFSSDKTCRSGHVPMKNIIRESEKKSASTAKKSTKYIFFI